VQHHRHATSLPKAMALWRCPRPDLSRGAPKLVAEAARSLLLDVWHCLPTGLRDPARRLRRRSHERLVTPCRVRIAFTKDQGRGTTGPAPTMAA
jgi:hypothetical protein